MSVLPFMSLFRELGQRETRAIVLMDGPGDQSRIPADRYELIEFYCTDPKCDCRRVLLRVIARSAEEPVCTISFGFDADDPTRGPYVDPLNPRRKFADEMLQLVDQMVLSDPKYVERLERHYKMVKDKVGGRSRFDPRALTPEQRIAERKRRRKTLKKVSSVRRRPGAPPHP
ncbi:MAG TPA: hypothetical protein VND64_21640 [Pirellulales bacterium]|nr:hypothetical protein [Pirellulales bacterium]